MSTASLTSSPATVVCQAPTASPPYAKAIVLSLVLALAAGLLYLPIVHHPFANIDDNGYVTENLRVQEGLTWPTVRWAMRSLDDNNWHPLTWLSIALDCQMFGLDPAGHHAMNIVYHSVDAVVLFWVLLLATGFLGRSFMAAALFALHPINVESVAWVAERKTVLSMLFFLLALGCYRWYAQRPGVLRYAVVAALFGLGLMAKAQIITLPCVLLLWDYWPLRRMFADSNPAAVANDSLPALAPKSFRWLLLEKVPLLLLCAASALATGKAQHVGHPQYWPYSAWIRIGNAIVAYVRYIGKALWPSRLAIMYLHPGNSLRLWQVALCGLLLLAITALVLMGRRQRYLPVGWFWFLGMLVPTIGLIQVGVQAMADRYAYQSFLGLFILVCWGVADWARRAHLPKPVLPATSIVVLLSLSLVAHRQIGYWKDNLTLWAHALQVTDNNWMAHDMVGGLLLREGRREDAMAHYRAAAAIAPNDAGSNLAIAIDAQAHGNAQQAVPYYKRAIAAMDDPHEQAMALQNLAAAYRDVGDLFESANCLRRAAQLRRLAQP